MHFWILQRTCTSVIEQCGYDISILLMSYSLFDVRYLNSNGLSSVTGQMFVSSSVHTLSMQNNDMYSLPDGALDELTLNNLNLDNNNLVVYPGNALATLSLQTV